MDDTHIIYLDRRTTFMFTQKNPKALTDALLAGSQQTGHPWAPGSVQSTETHTQKRKNHQATSLKYWFYFPLFYCC